VRGDRVMAQILEVDPDGTLRLPPEVLHSIRPSTRYRVESKDDALVLYPADAGQPLWAAASGPELAAAFRRWAASHENGPGLPDEAVSRESIYD
jgi:hypothetical protein